MTIFASKDSRIPNRLLKIMNEVSELEERAFNKVFEVGMPKTGTTSLGAAFRLLGLRTLGWAPKVHFEFTKRGDPEPALELALDHEAFEDGPWHNLPVRLLDSRFPDSKYILLEREGDDWYESMCSEYSDPKHVWFHQLGKQEWMLRKDNKYQGVLNYFSSRPQDILVMNIVDAGDGWDKLCPFLELPIPDAPFPWLNRR